MGGALPAGMKKSIENESPLTKIKIFNLMKKVTARCGEDDGFIDLKLFGALVNEIRMKINIQM